MAFPKPEWWSPNLLVERKVFRHQIFVERKFKGQCGVAKTTQTVLPMAHRGLGRLGVALRLGAWLAGAPLLCTQDTREGLGLWRHRACLRFMERRQVRQARFATRRSTLPSVTMPMPRTLRLASNPRAEWLMCIVTLLQ